MDAAGDDSILVHEIVADYRALVVGFYDWFAEALRRRNQPALDELDARAQEVAEALREAWGPPT
jgi:hypothetical protein